MRFCSLFRSSARKFSTNNLTSPMLALSHLLQLPTTLFTVFFVVSAVNFACWHTMDMCPCVAVAREDANNGNNGTTTITSTEHNQENENPTIDNLVDPAPRTTKRCIGGFYTPIFWNALLIGTPTFLLRPAVKVTVAVASAALLGLCISSALQWTIDFNVIDVMPSDSYASDFLTTQKVVTERAVVDAYVYFRHVNQSSLEVHAQMKTYIEDLVALEEVLRGPDFFLVIRL